MLGHTTVASCFKGTLTLKTSPYNKAEQTRLVVESALEYGYKVRQYAHSTTDHMGAR